MVGQLGALDVLQVARHVDGGLARRNDNGRSGTVAGTPHEHLATVGIGRVQGVGFETHGCTIEHLWHVLVDGRLELGPPAQLVGGIDGDVQLHAPADSLENL